MSIDPRVLVIEEMRKQTALLQQIAAALGGRSVAPTSDDAVCNGRFGDPVVKAKDPRDWTGEPMTGRHFSECPPEYLDLLADRFDYFASKEEDSTKQKYNLLDARRARAWAARIRGGWKPPVPAPLTDEGGF